MKPSTTPALRLSAVLDELISELSYLYEPLRQNVVNFSALARMLKPAVDRRLGQNVTPEAITMALRRNRFLSSPPVDSGLYEVVSRCKANILTDFVVIHYAYSEEFVNKLNRFKQELNLSGEKLYVVQRSDETSIVTHSRYLPEVHRLAGRLKPLAQNANQALLTIRHPSKGYGTPGLLNYFARLFNEAGVNIQLVFSTYSAISYLVDESSAPPLFERLDRSIRGIKDLA